MKTVPLLLLTNEFFQEAVKVMAKSLIRMRHNITKYYTVKSQLQAVSMRMQVCVPLLPFSPPLQLPKRKEEDRERRQRENVYYFFPNFLLWCFSISINLILSSSSCRHLRRPSPWRMP